jgi:acyl dehydratase
MAARGGPAIVSAVLRHEDRTVMLYAEDLAIGQRFPFRNYLLEESEIIDFARRYDPLFIHMDPAAAAEGPFGGLIASGLQTLAIYQRLVVEAMWTHVAGVAGAGIESRFLRPVRPGMTLTGYAEIAALVHRPERNNAVVTVKSQITDGTRQVLSVSLDAVIHSRKGHRQP